MAAETTSTVTPARHRPKSFTVFAAAFIAGAAAAVGVNRVLDVQLAQRRPQVECEPIFVALRPLAQGAPVTVWDVALKDWPKAMLPSSALRAGDAFEGYVLRHPVREGQPLLTVQLVKSGVATASTVATETFTPAVPAGPAVPTASPSAATQADPWMPSELIGQMTPAPATSAAQVAPIATAPQDQDRMPQAVKKAAAATKHHEPTPPTSTDVVTTSPPTSVIEQPAVAPVASEPTPADHETPREKPLMASTAQPMPPSPTDIDPPTRQQPTVSVSNELDEMSEAVVTDVQSMPSVMKASGQPVAQSTRPATGDPGRYLVVPERIALQADTSFTTPRPEPPGPPAAATAKQAGATPRPAASAPPSQTRRGAQPRPQAARSQQPQQQRAQSQANAREQNQAAAPSKPWGGMFPNVAAGIEAMSGSWQRSRPTAEQTTPTTQSKRR